MEEQIGRIFGGIILLVLGFVFTLNPKKHATTLIKACKKDITEGIAFAENFVLILGILFILGGSLSLIKFIFNLFR